MAIDKNDNILLASFNAKKREIIKPPYTTISGHLGSGLAGPTAVKINSANNRAWVSDYSGGVVYDLYYLSGKKLATISTGYAPYTAVDGSNYVP